MSYLIKPEGYKPLLDLKQTELGIKQIKEFFQLNLSSELRLRGWHSCRYRFRILILYGIRQASGVSIWQVNALLRLVHRLSL